MASFIAGQNYKKILIISFKNITILYNYCNIIGFFAKPRRENKDANWFYEVLRDCDENSNLNFLQNLLLNQDKLTVTIIKLKMVENFPILLQSIVMGLYNGIPL